MKIIKKLGMLAGVFIIASSMQLSMAATTTVTTSQAALKVAVVNVQEVLRQSPRVNALSKKLENDFKARQTKISDQQKSLQEEFDKLKKESPTMSQKDRETAQKKLTNQRSDLVKQVVAYQQDLQKEQNKVMENILADLNSIVSDIAKKDGYSLVLDSQAVIFAVDGNDVTKTVAKRFNDKS